MRNYIITAHVDFDKYTKVIQAHDAWDAQAQALQFGYEKSEWGKRYLVSTSASFVTKKQLQSEQNKLKVGF